MKKYLIGSLAMFLVTTVTAQKKTTSKKTVDSTKTTQKIVTPITDSVAMALGNTQLTVKLTLNQWNYLLAKVIDQADIKNLEVKMVKEWIVPQLEAELADINKKKK